MREECEGDQAGDRNDTLLDTLWRRLSAFVISCFHSLHLTEGEQSGQYPALDLLAAFTGKALSRTVLHSLYFPQHSCSSAHVNVTHIMMDEVNNSE